MNLDRTQKSLLVILSLFAQLVATVILCSCYTLADYTDRLGISEMFYETWPRGYKTIFILSLAETESYPAHKC